jgi:hypothetical protein
MARMFPTESKRLCGATNLKMAERHRIMIQRSTDRTRTTQTDDNCIILEGLIREDQRVHEIASVTCIGKPLFIK